MCKIIFNFKTFKIDKFQDDEQALWITYGLYSYIVFVSKEDVGLGVLESKINNVDNKYHKIKIFYGDACWYQCFDWIKNRSI